MLVRQLFYHPTFSYTYLLADPTSKEAVLIDPVKSKLRSYVQLFNELGLTAVAAIDTHYHDDRVTGLAVLRDLWGCESIAGAPNDMPGLTKIVQDGDIIRIGGLQLNVIHTPGHSDDSYCFLIEQPGKSAIFTGDTLLVRTVGLSNQATSDPTMHYDSLMNVLAKLPDSTLVYPGRDFKGWPMSTIGEEKNFNPYLNTANLSKFLALKAKQQPAEIQALMKVEDDQDEEIELTATPGSAAAFGAAPPTGATLATATASNAGKAKFGSDFQLPDDDRAADAAAPAKKTDSADALKNRAATKNRTDKSVDLDDTAKLPSWR